MKDFRTFNTAVSFYRSSLSLRLCGTLKEQLSRAASSIALNLAEGRGKESRKDQLRFFFIALGSLRECQAILILAGLEASEAWGLLDKTGAQLNRLIKNAV